MLRSLLALLIGLAVAGVALAQSDAELYGRDPEVSHFAMSPSGNVVAFARMLDGEKVVVVQSLVDGETKVFNASADDLRDVAFYNEDHVLMFKTTERTRKSGVISINWRTGNTQVLLAREKEIAGFNGQRSRIFSAGAKDDEVIMGVSTGQTRTTFNYDLMRVNLETGATWRLKRGDTITRDWFVGDSETIYAREVYSNRYERHILQLNKNGVWSDLAREKGADFPERHYVGVSQDRKAIVFLEDNPGTNSRAAFHVSLSDGAISEAVFSKPSRDVVKTIKQNGVVLGVQFAGATPAYEFYDEELSSEIAALVAKFPGNSLEVLELSEDLNQVLVYLSGNDTTGMYGRFHVDEKRLEWFAAARSQLGQTGLSKTDVLTVRARDGLEIPVFAIYPKGVEPGSDAARKLPTIVMPHGGVEGLDKIGFDYMPQFLAHKGYLVVQPNYRGSFGYGLAYREAGRGKWGEEIQNDITDALDHFVQTGVTDAERVCIVGENFGGYSALSGGAFTSELYKCVVSIGGISDFSELSERIVDSWADLWVLDFWDNELGGKLWDRKHMKSISPYYHANNFSAPVLLIHGDDDTLSPIQQSQRMRNKLRQAGKDVEFIKLKDITQRLETEDARIKTLEAMGAFIDQHLKNADQS